MAKGTSAHSAFPEGSQNAIQILMELLLKSQVLTQEGGAFRKEDTAENKVPYWRTGRNFSMWASPAKKTKSIKENFISRIIEVDYSEALRKIMIEKIKKG